MVFLLCGNEYINIEQITSIQPYMNINNFGYSIIRTSDGREYLFPMKAKDIIDGIKEEV